METGFEYFARIAAFVGEILDGRIDLTPIPLYLTCGLGGENLTNNKKMVEALERCGCRVRFTEVPDAHNWTAWRDCLGPGLLKLLT